MSSPLCLVNNALLFSAVVTLVYEAFAFRYLSKYLLLNSKNFNMESHAGAFLYGEENVDRRGEGYDARRWPEGTFVLCGGKCTFGPVSRNMSCCPWDACEHILAFGSGIPRGTRATNNKVITRLLGLTRFPHPIARSWKHQQM